MARTTIATPGFLDRLGDRVLVTDRSGGDLEVLRLRPELTADPAFEARLKARAEELNAFNHHGAAKVRGVSRLPAPDGRLAIVSDAVKGWRLSEVLQAAEHEGRLIHTSAVLFLLRQVASVVAALHAAGNAVSHGALGPDRIVVTPTGRLVVVEYVLGSALALLPPLSADRTWKDLRIPVPADADGDRFGRRTDVIQLGIVALSLVHNRQLRRDEYPGRLHELIDTATESKLTGSRQPIGPRLRDWLERALALAGHDNAWSMADAQHGLDLLVSKEGGYFATPVGLEPLLQSVDRFFTLPPAEPQSSDAKEQTTSDPVSAPPATAAAVAAPPESPAPRPVHSGAADAAAELLASPASAGTLETATVRGPLLPEEPAAVEPPSQLRQEAEVLDFPTRPAVTISDDHVVLDSLTAPRDQGAPTAEAALDEGSEPLLVRGSPLAEFAAERADAEAPPERRPTMPVVPFPPRGVPAPPPPPLAAPEAPEVGPVADMLSLGREGRPSRRSARDPWAAVPRERPSGSHRSALATAALPEPLPPPHREPRAESTPVRGHAVSADSGSGAVRVAREAAPAAPLLPAPAAEHDERPAPLPSHLDLPFPSRDDVAAPPAPADPPASAADASALSDRPARGVTSSGSVAVAGRSLFGVESDAEEHASDARKPKRGGKGLWIAAALLLVAGVGLPAAWTFLRPWSATPAKDGAKAQAEAVLPSGAPAKPVNESTAGGSTATPGALGNSQPATSVPAPTAAAATPEQPAAAAVPETGSLLVASSASLLISEKGQQVGATGTALTLPAGRHVLEIASEELAYKTTRAVDVKPGRTTRVDVALPQGAANINASPWAEVFIDGQRVGETPLGNLQLTLGSHEVRFRHPQFTEQVQTLVVTAGAPARLSVEMKK